MAHAASLRGGARDDDEGDADQLRDRGPLGEHEQSDQDAEGRLDGEQRAERCVSHAAQGQHLEPERDHRSDEGDPRCDRQHPPGDVAGDDLRQPDRQSSQSRDWDGQRQTADPGEPVADVLSEDVVQAPARSRSQSEPDPSQVDVSIPGLGQEDDADEGEQGPRERLSVLAHEPCHGEWPEELDRDRGAERDAFDGSEEGRSHEASHYAKCEQRRKIPATHRADRRTGDHPEEDHAEAHSQPGRACGPDLLDHRDRERVGDLDGKHRRDRHRPRRDPLRTAAADHGAPTSRRAT